MKAKNVKGNGHSSVSTFADGIPVVEYQEPYIAPHPEFTEEDFDFLERWSQEAGL